MSGSDPRFDPPPKKATETVEGLTGEIDRLRDYLAELEAKKLSIENAKIVAENQKIEAENTKMRAILASVAPISSSGTATARSDNVSLPVSFMYGTSGTVTYTCGVPIGGTITGAVTPAAEWVTEVKAEAKADAEDRSRAETEKREAEAEARAKLVAEKAKMPWLSDAIPKRWAPADARAVDTADARRRAWRPALAKVKPQEAADDPASDADELRAAVREWLAMRPGDPRPDRWSPSRCEWRPEYLCWRGTGSVPELVLDELEKELGAMGYKTHREGSATFTVCDPALLRLA